MSRLGILLLVLLFTMSMSAPVAAQAATNSTVEETQTTTTQPTTTETTETADQSDETETVVAQVDSQLRVTNYSYSEEDSVMFVTLSNSGPGSSQATLTEAIDPSSDSSSFGIEQVEISEDETVEVVVNLRTDTTGGAGVMITTPESIDQGSGAFVSADSSAFDMFDGESPTWALARLSAIGSALGVSLLVVLYSWQLISSNKLNPETVA